MTNRNYDRAVDQVTERLDEANDMFVAAEAWMRQERPEKAIAPLEEAKGRIDAALVSARWGVSLMRTAAERAK